MLNLAAHLLFNALVIRGLWRAMSYSEDEETGGPLKESRMLLTGVRVWMQRTLGYFWSKPLVSCPACMVHGLLYFLPVYLVTLIVGGNLEALFAVVRRHEITEGFLVTSLDSLLKDENPQMKIEALFLKLDERE